MKIVIDGAPTPLKRPRAFTCKDTIRMYNSQKKQMLEFAEKVQEMLPSSFDPHPRSVILSVTITFFMPIPASAPRTLTTSLDGTPHIKRPDTTNLCKFVEDSLNGVLWEDDSQIATLNAYKVYAKRPRTVIEVFTGR